MRRLLIGAVPFVATGLLAVQPVAAETPFTVGSGGHPDVAMTPSGEAHVVWVQRSEIVDGADALRYCRIAAGARQCTRLTAIGNPHPDRDILATPQVFSVGHDDVAIVATTRTGSGTATELHLPDPEEDDELAPPIRLPYPIPAAGVVLGPGALVSGISDAGAFRAAPRAGQPQPPTPLVLSSGSALGAAVALDGAQPVAAWWEQAGGGAIQVSRYAGAADDVPALHDSANWTAPAAVDASLPPATELRAPHVALAGGVGRLYLGHVDAGAGDARPVRVHEIESGAATGSSLASGAGDRVRSFAMGQDPAGNLHVVYDADGLHWRTGSGTGSWRVANRIAAADTVHSPSLAAADDSTGIVAYASEDGTGGKVRAAYAADRPERARTPTRPTRRPQVRLVLRPDAGDCSRTSVKARLVPLRRGGRRARIAKVEFRLFEGINPRPIAMRKDRRAPFTTRFRPPKPAPGAYYTVHARVQIWRGRRLVQQSVANTFFSCGAQPGARAAALPGPNGAIVYSQVGSDPEDDVGSEPPADGASDIWSVDPAGRHRVNLTRDPETDTDPAVSADGRRIAFSRSGYRFCNEPGCRDAHIWVMNGDGSGRTQVTQGPRRLDSQPAFSPDGNRIAFRRMSSDPATPVGIYVVNADGSTETNLTPTGPEAPTTPSEPDFSPDGERIAFAGFVRTADRRSDSEIFVMDADGGNLQRLTHDSELRDSSPSFSPDGTKIAWNSGGDIWVMASDGSGRKQLTSGGTDADPSYSPDGSGIAFSREIPWHYSGGFQAGNPEIFVMNSDGTEPRNVTRDREGWGAPQATPYWGSGSPIEPGSTQRVLTLRAHGSQRARRLGARIRCTQPCSVRVRGFASAGGRRFRLKPVRVELAAAEQRVVRLRFGRKSSLRRLERLARNGVRARARIFATAAEPAETRRAVVKLSGR